MVGRGRDHVRNREQRVARERAATVVQSPPAGQDEFAPSAQHFVRNQGAPPRPDLLSSLLSAQRQGQRQEDPHDPSMQPRPEVLGSLIAAQQVYPQDQAEQVAREIEARIQEQNVEAQRGDEGQAQVLADRSQGVQPIQQALSQQQHRSNVQEAALRHRENQIAHIINVSTPTPTRAQAERILRHQRIRFMQVSHWTAEELRIRRLVLQNIASLWQMLAAIEVIPAVILPRYVHVPVSLRGLVDPTDLTTWDGRILDGLHALAELTPGRPEPVAALLQQSVRRRRVKGLGHDCLTLWDVEDVLGNIRSRQQRGGAGETGDGRARQDSSSQTTLSSDDEGDDNNQGEAGATRGNQQNYPINDPALEHGHAGFVALTGCYGLDSSLDASSDSDNSNEADKNGTQDVETKHSLSANAPSSRPRTRSQTSAHSPTLDPVAEARTYNQSTQQDQLHIQYMQRLHANRPSPYNSDVSSNSTPSSSGVQIGPDGLPVRDAEDDDEIHIDSTDEVKNSEEASSRPRTRSQPSAASNSSSHSDLYRDPSPETVVAARAIRLENANTHVNGGQNARGGRNVEDDGDTTLVNAGGTTIAGTTLVDDGEMDGPRSTSVAPSIPSKNERPRAVGLYNRFIDRIDRMVGSRAGQHDGIPRPQNVEFIPTGRDSAENDVDTTLEVAGEGSWRIVLSRTPSTPSANRPCTRSQTSAALHQSSSSNREEAAREAEEEQRLTDAHEAARHAFETRHARIVRVPLIDRMMDGYLGATPSEDERRRDQILRNFAARQGQAYNGDSAFGDEEVDHAALNDEEVSQGGEEEPAREDEGFPSYAAVTNPPQRNDTEARNSSHSCKRRRTRSWGSRTFKPSPSKKRKTESPEPPTPPSRAMTPPQPRRGASLLSSTHRTPSSSSGRSGEAEVEISLHTAYDQMIETRARAAAAAEGEQSGSEQVEEDQSEGETEEENEEAQDEDTSDENEADDRDDDKDDNHIQISTSGEENDEGDEDEGEKTPSSSSSSSLPSSSSSSSSSGNSNSTSPLVEPDSKNVQEQVSRTRNDPNVPEAMRHMTRAEFNELGAKFDEEQASLRSEGDNSPFDDGNDDEYDNGSLPESVIYFGNSSDLNSSESSEEEYLFPSSSYAESDSNRRLPSNVTDSDHESYDFTPSPSPLAQGQGQHVYDEMQADEDAYYQFIQEQYGESIADFFRNIDRQHGRERPETEDESDALGDFYQAQHARSSLSEEHTEPGSASSSSIRSLNNAYDNARRTSTADARMRELSGRPRTRSGDLDYDGTHLESESSQSIRSDRLRSVSGAGRTTRSSSASGRSGTQVGDMYMGRRVTRVIRLRPGECILVEVAPKES